MTQTTTALLVIEAQRGDKQAFDALCERYYLASFRFAFKLSGCEQNAADITQDVWSKVAKDIRVLLEPSAFKAWLFRAVYRRFIDLTRRHKKELLVDTVPEQEVEQFKRVEAGLDLRSLISRLPEVERHTVYLFYLEELTIGDIAAVLETPVGTIKSRLHSARKKLSDAAQN
ncbi:RNA polymerase sigma factor [Pseudoalteromonas pernae]|uniref:RNA polymerase sigma factor n=1 Tax=Pseudoalteromonas pernae TaxID=3118054 RepID=UPI00324228EE